jgi:hypothetical protein
MNSGDAGAHPRTDSLEHWLDDLVKPKRLLPPGQREIICPSGSSQPTPSDVARSHQRIVALMLLRAQQLDRKDDIRRALVGTGKEAARIASLAAAAITIPCDERGAAAALIQNDFVENERKLRKAVISSRDAASLRRWWAAVGAALRMLGDPHEKLPPSAPKELFLILADMADHLGGGQIPDTIGMVAKKGRNPIGPAEKRDILVAVTYRRAVEMKIVVDPAPVKSIMKAYGLRSARAVQNWCKDYPQPLRQLLKFPDSLTGRMQQAGRNYRQANHRTEEAFRRGKKMHDPARK